MIRMKNVSARYGNKEVLHNINIEFVPGKLTVLVGPNGCGKSTLLKTLIRLKEYTSGEIFVEEHSIRDLNSNVLAQKIAYLPQGKNAPDITVGRMVLHGRFAYLKYPRRYRKIDYQIAQKAMKWVGIEHLAEQNVNELSGGMQQKVYIAMTLAQDTRTILMDEPTTYLDIQHQMKLMDMAKDLTAQGKAVVMVLHDLSQAFRNADYIVVMDDGRIKACGTPEEIYEKKTVDEVFQIRLNRVFTETGYQYFSTI